MRIYIYTTMQNSLPTPELFDQFLENRLTAAELELLFTYFGTANEAELRSLILEELDREVEYAVQNEEHRLEVIHSKLTENIFGTTKAPVVRKLMIGRIARVAAILIAVVSVSLLTYKLSNSQNYHIVPGGPKASLVVNGIAKNLTGQKGSLLFHSKGVTVTTKADGSIIYTAINADSATASKMNSLETPRGGEYRVTLSDGTMVTLNSGSKLSFPTGFRGAERKVTLEGEGFFEVTKNPKMPFIVDVDGRAIRVLGTKFNVSSYEEDRGVTATLLEGSILFTDKNNQQLKLKPNQQVISQAGKLTLNDVEAADYLAWTKGDFLFNDMPIAAVLQKLGRWYDVDVDLQSLPDKNLYLKISRNANINDVLKLLSKATDLHFELDGNRISIKE